MDQDTNAGQQGSGQSAQADLNKIVGSAKEATAGFQLSKLFEGRIGNMPFLYAFVGSVILGLLFSMIPLLNMIAWLVLAVVGVGMGIRRFHDINVTGWAVLSFFIPFVGLLVALYLCWKHGDEGENTYGAAPDAQRPIFKAILNS